jgi:argininosuccinate lyase
LWGARFAQTPHEALDSINRSIDVDRRLYEEDIQGSVAYASALRAAGVITVQEEGEIHGGLKTVSCNITYIKTVTLKFTKHIPIGAS